MLGLGDRPATARVKSTVAVATTFLNQAEFTAPLTVATPAAVATTVLP